MSSSSPKPTNHEVKSYTELNLEAASASSGFYIASYSPDGFIQITHILSREQRVFPCEHPRYIFPLPGEVGFGVICANRINLYNELALKKLFSKAEEKQETKQETKAEEKFESNTIAFSWPYSPFGTGLKVAICPAKKLVFINDTAEISGQRIIALDLNTNRIDQLPSAPVVIHRDIVFVEPNYLVLIACVRPNYDPDDLELPPVRDYIRFYEIPSSVRDYPFFMYDKPQLEYEYPHAVRLLAWPEGKLLAIVSSKDINSYPESDSDEDEIEVKPDKFLYVKFWMLQGNLLLDLNSNYPTLKLCYNIDNASILRIINSKLIFNALTENNHIICFDPSAVTLEKQLIDIDQFPERVRNIVDVQHNACVITTNGINKEYILTFSKEQLTNAILETQAKTSLPAPLARLIAEYAEGGSVHGMFNVRIRSLRTEDKELNVQIDFITQYYQKLLKPITEAKGDAKGMNENKTRYEAIINAMHDLKECLNDEISQNLPQIVKDVIRRHPVLKEINEYNPSFFQKIGFRGPPLDRGRMLIKNLLDELKNAPDNPLGYSKKELK